MHLNLVHLKKQANSTVAVFKGEGMGAEPRRPSRRQDADFTVDLTKPAKMRWLSG